MFRKAPTTQEERTHWDKNMQLVLDVVTGEDFPAGRTIQTGLTSGAQTHTVYRPQRAGHDPLSPVAAGRARSTWPAAWKSQRQGPTVTTVRVKFRSSRGGSRKQRAQIGRWSGPERA